MRLYNLVSSAYGVSNLSLKRLKVSRINKLNDPFELLAADLLDPRHREAVQKMKDKLDTTNGLICFSEDWHSPLLWGHYADSHKGMALGFDVPDDRLFKVNYTTNRAKITFDEKTRKVKDGKRVVQQLVSTKYKDWAYEQEQRMFIELTEGYEEAGNIFLDFSDQLQLKEIILGVKCSLSIERIRKLVQHYELPIKVMKAGMALRTFRVIEDRTQRP